MQIVGRTRDVKHFEKNYDAMRQHFFRIKKKKKKKTEPSPAVELTAYEAYNAIVTLVDKKVELLNARTTVDFYDLLNGFIATRYTPPTVIPVIETQRGEVPVDELDALIITYPAEVRCVHCNDSFVPLDKNDATQVCAECTVEHARQVA